jgi:hypothetical protein
MKSFGKSYSFPKFPMRVVAVLSFALLSRLTASVHGADSLPPALPGELSAQQVLDGAYPFPPSPQVESHEDATGFDKSRLSPVPPPGVHPRILISPEDLPKIRDRWQNTETGRGLVSVLHARLKAAIHTPGTAGNDLFEKLVAGDIDGAMAIINAHPELLGTVAHYQFYIPTCLAWQSLDALVNQDQAEGKEAAAALTTWIKLIRPSIDRDLSKPLADDVFRITAMPGLGDGPTTSKLDGKFRDLLGYQVIGYAYDFDYNFMTDDQRAVVRSAIAKATAGKLWMGCRLPHHFRNWNWIEIGLSQPLLSLAIEGEEGYDPRVFKLGEQIARDYFDYGISAKGMATEAVGYMNFGLVWGNPFAIAATRRGDNLLLHSHYRALADWYVSSLQPQGGEYESHGDGGDSGPQPWTLYVWRYLYPNDPRIDFLYQNYVQQTHGKPYDGNFHLIEPLLFACDGPKAADGKPVDYADGAALNQPTTFFDPARGSLNARSEWSAKAAVLEFECRNDSVGASHEHADRGSFTLSAMGRDWSRESFRSVETRHHSSVLIDGLGQGYWPGPGNWLGLKDEGWALSAACDAKPAYDWWWPKEIVAENADFVRFQYPRWAGYTKESAQFHIDNAGVPMERDDRPSVVAHWKGFVDVAGGPRMWDEDSWPVRLPHNPVQRAFRTLLFVRQPEPYLVIADDIQKDTAERLYEWIMMTGTDTDCASIKGNDIILCDATVPRDQAGLPKPKKGDRELLVRIVQMNGPAAVHQHQAVPSIRLESFEKKDTNSPEGRTYGIDKRLIIPTRAVAPDFKILLFPMHAGDTLPTTNWDQNHTQLTVEWNGKQDHLAFESSKDGRTRITLSRDGEKTVEAVQP